MEIPPTFGGLLLVGRVKSQLGFCWCFSMCFLLSSMGFLRFLPGFGMILAYVFPPMLHLERWGVSLGVKMLNGSAASPGRRVFHFTPKGQRHTGQRMVRDRLCEGSLKIGTSDTLPHIVESSWYTDDR